MRDQIWIGTWPWIFQIFFQLIFLALLIQPIFYTGLHRPFFKKEINYFSFSTWIIVYSIIIHAPLTFGYIHEKKTPCILVSMNTDTIKKEKKTILHLVGWPFWFCQPRHLPAEVSYSRPVLGPKWRTHFLVHWQWGRHYAVL